MIMFTFVTNINTEKSHRFSSFTFIILANNYYIPNTYIILFHLEDFIFFIMAWFMFIMHVFSARHKILCQPLLDAIFIDVTYSNEGMTRVFAVSTSNIDRSEIV